MYCDVHRISQKSILSSQKYGLIRNIEKMSFWSCDNQKLHFDKRELLAQINNLNISINGIGFFKIDRQFLVRVSFSTRGRERESTIRIKRKKYWYRYYDF